MRNKIVFCVLIVLFGGCQYVGALKEIFNNNPDLNPFPTPTPTVEVTPGTQPTVTPTKVPTQVPTKTPTVVATPVLVSNPVCGTKELPSKAHLLWKPVSDTSGNAVIVFDGKYKEEFKSVQVELKDGSTENAWWKGLELWGNPDSVGPRQHWRLTKKCASYKNNTLITVKDSKQTCVFKLEGKSCNRIE